jgi:hypothetical protein
MKQAQTAPRPRTEVLGTQLLVTLGDRDGEIARVETVDKAGKKHELLDEDFAALVGDHDIMDLLPVLEQAYMVGFSDASGDVFESDSREKETGDDDLEDVVIRGVASQKLIRRGVRNLILARLVKRELQRKQGSASTVLPSETSH